MIQGMFSQVMAFLSAQYMYPVWIFSGAIVIAGGAAVAIKSIFYGGK